MSSKGVRAIGGYMADANVGVEFHVASGGEDDLQFPVDETTTEAADVEVSLVPDRLYLSLDHVEYISQHDVDVNATSLGLRLSFSGP